MTAKDKVTAKMMAECDHLREDLVEQTKTFDKVVTERDYYRELARLYKDATKFLGHGRFNQYMHQIAQFEAQTPVDAVWQMRLDRRRTHDSVMDMLKNAVENVRIELGDTL